MTSASKAATTASDERAGGEELAFAGLEQQVRMLAVGEVSSQQLVELALARIEATRSSLNAFRVVRAEQAMAEAEAADERLGAGDGAPLLGVPIAIKDDVDLAGEATPFGCDGPAPTVTEDAELVRRLRAAGAVIVGKTNAPEVGQWHFTETRAFGATRNPWNRRHTPGGSSGGAAAAVAAGLVPAAIGSDGAGSIRIPAAWTGLVGVKPQRGRISTWPDVDPFNGLTVFGPLTRSVADAALLLDVLSGSRADDRHRPPPPPRTFAAAIAEPPRPLRIGLSFTTPLGVPSKVDDEIRGAVERIAARLEDLGHRIVRTNPSYGLVGPAMLPRGMGGVDAWLREHGVDRSLLEPRTVDHARFGRLLSGLPLRISRAAEPALRRRAGRVFDRVDVVLTPTTAKPAPRIGALDGRGYWATSTTATATCPFAWAWNVVGWPGVNVPAGRTSSGGLPIGAQLLGRENDEGTLLALAAQLEAELGWADERPPAA